MSLPSNLYAEKIYSEQPQIMWSLDDQADYITLITEAQRDISDGWTLTNCTATTSTSDVNAPFENSVLNFIEGTAPTTSSVQIECISQDIVNLSDLNSNLGSFCIGLYFYSVSTSLEKVEIGFEYTDPDTLDVIQQFKTFNISTSQQWSFVSGTFNIINENADLRIIVRFTCSGALSYDFYTNGITLGQWSEDFNAISLGVTPISFPANIAVSSTSAVAADAYGLGGESGYYLINDNNLVAKNTGIPIVYGASNVTRITPNTEGVPSLIIPGQGILNKIGQYKDYTLEFWAKINSNTYTPKKIVGPIGSSDGIYVESGFITLVIGTEFRSHFVGEWYRPMLIHLRIIRNNATLLINGEEVINLPIQTNSLNLPAQLDNSGDNQDWIGFYAYEEVTPIEIDCVAIYPYSVPISVAKRRWVYGQAVVSPESINSAYGGVQAFIDYPFADYTANYNYPNFAKWSQGSFDNLSTTNTSLVNPNYSLPQISLGNKTIQDLYEDNQNIQDPLDDYFITFRPDVSWDSDHCYFNFSRLSLLTVPVDTIYGVFSSDDLLSEETLFKIYDKVTKNYFAIRKNQDEIYYFLYFNGTEQEIYTTDVIPENKKYLVGIQIPKLISFFGGNVATFFGNRNNLEMYVGGDQDSQNQFTGKIYSIGISTAYNGSQISSYFESNGTATLDDAAATGEEESANAKALLAHTASYTLLPTEAYDTYFLDIGISGYWEDYLPLSYFAQDVTNTSGNKYYDLDFLQFNIGYPAPTKLKEETTTGSWTYSELKETYSSPVQRTYFQLDNLFFTGWDNYEDMMNRVSKYFEYDTTDAAIRSYLTFQYIEEGANEPISNFQNYEPPKEGNVIKIDDYPNWLTTKFEVLDNTLIYPTKTVDFNKIAVVYHLDFNIRGILKKPISLRRLEWASQAFNDNSFNPIGTRFGSSLFPYTRSGLYFDYKAQNPFSIYKGSTPYLYLNRTSGIEIRGEFDPTSNRGIAFPVNPNVADNYRINAVQLWMRYDKDQFPSAPTQIFEIAYKADTVRFYMVSDNPQATRARIFALSANTGKSYSGISYYWNGSLVREPAITLKEWGSLGIAFPGELNFDLFIGGINLNGPLVFNNISYYRTNSLQQEQSSIKRKWSQVLSTGGGSDWVDWKTSYTWEGVLIINAENIYFIDPSEIYKTYIGTNKIIVDDNEGMIVDSDLVKIYSDTTWSVRVGSAV